MTLGSNQNYSRVSELSNIKRGDIFYFRSFASSKDGSKVWENEFHVGFVTKDAEENGGKYEFSIFHSWIRGVGPTGINWARIWNGADGDWDAEILKNKDGEVIKEITPDESSIQIDFTKAYVYRPSCGCDSPDKDVSKAKESAPFEDRDPLLVDLDGNGIQTLGLDAGIHFDHDGNGFMELTGWADSGTGVLMLDINGNDTLDTGEELFGDFTILPNGVRAENGFQALAYYDANDDGKIDANDPIWSEIKVWQGDYYINTGYSEDPHEQGVISTLDELGITAINLNYTDTNITDEAGNTVVRSAEFVWKDGSAGTIAEYSLQTDTGDTELVDVLEVSPEISALPQLYGSGTLPDLHQAMARDTSGTLKALVEEFAAESTPENRASLLQQLISTWTPPSKAGSVATSTGFISARKVVLLEHFFGEDLPIPDDATANGWENTYNEISEFYYAELMSQTHLKPLYDKLVYTVDQVTGEPKTDFSAVIPDIVAELANDPQQGKQLLSEFARTLRGHSSCSHNCYLVFREHMLAIDPELGWVFDTGGLPVIDGVDQGTRSWSRRIEGTDNADIAKALLDQGADANVKGHLGWTALKVARRERKEEMVQLLKAMGAKEEKDGRR